MTGNGLYFLHRNLPTTPRLIRFFVSRFRSNKPKHRAPRVSGNSRICSKYPKSTYRRDSDRALNKTWIGTTEGRLGDTETPPLWMSCLLSRTTIECVREGLRRARAEKNRKEWKTGEEFKVCENFSSCSAVLIRTERFSSIRIKSIPGQSGRPSPSFKYTNILWNPGSDPLEPFWVAHWDRKRSFVGPFPRSEPLIAAFVVKTSVTQAPDLCPCVPGI